MAVATAAQMRALSHPTRVRLWTTLGSGDATISQLSNRLSINKGNVAHHLTVLTRAGLVRPTREAMVRGGTQRYFGRSQDRMVFAHDRDGTSRAMAEELADGIVSAEDPMVHQRNIRLTPQQAAALQRHLDALLHSLSPADDRHPSYQIITAIYRRG